MRKLTLIVPLCTLILMTVLMIVLAIPTPKDKLEKAIVGADKMIISYAPGPGQISVRPAITLTGKDKIAEFLNCLAFDSTSDLDSRAFHNACLVNLYKGDELVAELLCDFERMNWSGGEWDGCAILSEDSGKALRAWLEENGLDCSLEKVQ